jgi:hypothetical protein
VFTGGAQGSTLSGDTLAELARKHQVAQAVIARLRNFMDAEALRSVADSSRALAKTVADSSRDLSRRVAESGVQERLSGAVSGAVSAVGAGVAFKTAAGGEIAAVVGDGAAGLVGVSVSFLSQTRTENDHGRAGESRVERGGFWHVVARGVAGSR